MEEGSLYGGVSALSREHCPPWESVGEAYRSRMKSLGEGSAQYLCGAGRSEDVLCSCLNLKR